MRVVEQRFTEINLRRFTPIFIASNETHKEKYCNKSRSGAKWDCSSKDEHDKRKNNLPAFAGLCASSARNLYPVGAGVLKG